MKRFFPSFFNALCLALIMLGVTGCASMPTSKPGTPARLGLKLSPASLDASIALQQHLKVERNGRIDELDAALEADAEHVQLVGLAFGQRVLSLNYDGKELTSWRHAFLPAQVRTEDVLEDIQLTLWPVAAIAAQLPSGWRIEESGQQRTLYLDEQVVARIRYSGPSRFAGTVVLENLRYQYRLTIESVGSAEPGAAVAGGS